jgi:hypothetical protein
MSRGKITRRDWLGRLCAALGAAVAAPWLGRAAGGGAPAAPEPVSSLSVVPAAGSAASATFVYDGSGSLLRIVNHDCVTTFTYEAGLLAGVRDPAGNEVPLSPPPA